LLSPSRTKAARERLWWNCGNSKKQTYHGDTENKIAKIAEIAKEWKLKIKSFNRKGHEGTQRGKKPLKSLRLTELRKEIALGAREADCGKFVDEARIFAEIRRKSKQWKIAGR